MYDMETRCERRCHQLLGQAQDSLLDPVDAEFVDLRQPFREAEDSAAIECSRFESPGVGMKLECPPEFKWVPHALPTDNLWFDVCHRA